MLAKPFLKWAGGKRHIAAELEALFPSDWLSRPYVEPFVGAGGMVLSLSALPSAVHLADSNAALIQTWRAVCLEPLSVSLHLEELADNYEAAPEATFTQMRRIFNRTRSFDDAVTAAQVIFLNKTCFNGLWRENKAGEFNVPWGKRTSVTLPTLEELEAVSRVFAVRDTDIRCRHSLASLAAAPTEAFVYCDPPYVGTFTAYHSKGFDAHDLQCLEIALRGREAPWMVSHADNEIARTVFSAYRLRTIKARRSIAANGNRRPADELVITNY